MLYVIATILFVYPIFFFLSRRYQSLQKFRKWVDILSLATVVLVIIFSTGGLLSPFFFLTYFLLFTLAISYGVVLSATSTLILVIVFFLAPKVDIIRELIQLLSLLAIIPVIIYMGKMQDKKKSAEETIKFLEDENEVLEEEISEKSPKQPEN